MTSAREPSSGNPGEAERLLASLAGVVSAHVVADAEGQIIEIHVLAAPDLHPKQVVRNVESALSAGLGLQVDRRIVSVAQIRARDGTNGDGGASGSGSDHHTGQARTEPDGEGEGAERNPEQRRLEYVRYKARRDAERCTCEVILRDEDAQVTGNGAGPDTAAGRAEAAARAVIDAIQKARPHLRLGLEGAVISSSRGKRHVIVAAHSLLDRSTVPLAGAAPLSRSPEEAAILAALQATNRWSA
jgi:hypothetical protein